MKKVTFYKTMYNGKNNPPKLEKAEGYRETYTLPGTGETISLVFEKRAYEWAITEESTGLLVRRNFNTRRDAINSITPELIRLIAEIIPGQDRYRTSINIERGKHEEV